MFIVCSRILEHGYARCLLASTYILIVILSAVKMFQTGKLKPTDLFISIILCFGPQNLYKTLLMCPVKTNLKLNLFPRKEWICIFRTNQPAALRPYLFESCKTYSGCRATNYVHKKWRALFESSSSVIRVINIPVFIKLKVSRKKRLCLLSSVQITCWDLFGK